MTMTKNVITMKFVCEDNWGNDVYRSIETDILYKNTEPDSENHSFYTCGNEIDGDPGFPIDKNIEIHFIDKPNRPSEADRFNYMMLSRLKSDCDYYLGYGNKCKNRLWAGNEKEQIEEMKKLYNSFSDDKKPQWLTWEQIEKYEKEMVK